MRSCAKQIFTLRNIIEQCTEFQQPLSINFVDFKKAFDSVHRESLWNIAMLYGIPEHYVNIFRMLCLNSHCCARTDTSFTEMFDIITGVCQGCILLPFLFLLVIDFIMQRAMNGPNMGIKWTDSSRLADLDFLDGLSLLAETRDILQEMTTNLETEAEKVGLKISAEKTKVMQIGGGRAPHPITVGQKNVDDVECFTYLGSVMTEDGGAEADVNCRVGKQPQYPALATDMDILCGQHCYKDMAVQ